MQTCYNCGKQVPDETLICPDCGALVRRYIDAPAAQPTPAEPPQAAEDRVRLTGGVKVWLIILCIFSGYMAFSSLCSVLLANHPQLFDAFSGAEREALEMMLSARGLESIEAFISLLELLKPVFILLTVLFAAKFVCHLWLLRSARRLSFYFSIGVSVAGLLGALVLGGSVSAVLYFLDPLITWVNLRRFWPRMPK